MNRSIFVGAAVAAACLALSADSLRAQTCLGNASFTGAPVRLGAVLSFADGVKSYGAELGVGGSGLFASAGVSLIDYDDIDESGTGIDVLGGYSLPIGTTGRAELCPIVAYSHQGGPNFDTPFGEIEFSGRSIGGGVALGGTYNSTPRLDLVPFAAAMYTSVKVKATFFDETDSETEGVTVLSGGVGFVVDRRLTIQPRISFPIGGEDNDPVFTIALRYNFGRAGR
jgi:hypothetical protein